jgi:hypothetical protein
VYSKRCRPELFPARIGRARSDQCALLPRLEPRIESLVADLWGLPGFTSLPCRVFGCQRGRVQPAEPCGFARLVVACRDTGSTLVMKLCRYRVPRSRRSSSRQQRLQPICNPIARVRAWTRGIIREQTKGEVPAKERDPWRVEMSRETAELGSTQEVGGSSPPSSIAVVSLTTCSGVVRTDGRIARRPTGDAGALTCSSVATGCAAR